MWCITFIDLQILYQPYIPGVNPTWSWYMIFIMLRYAPYIPTLLSVFIISGCCNLSNAFSTSIYMIMGNLSFFFLCDVLHLLICKYCTILVFLVWIPLDHGVWSFYVLVDAVCQYFVGDFSIYVYQQYWLIVFFLCCIFIWFWD